MDAKTLMLAANVSASVASEWAGPITAAMTEFGISTPERQAAFIAQCAHESMGFHYTLEIWGPTAAQKGYEGRADLGNTQTGDGRRYCGRGLLQVTGRANYATTGKKLGVDLIADPVQLEHPDLAARSAGLYWRDHGCNELADIGAFTSITKKINGGQNGASDRLLRWNRAKQALGLS